MNDSNLKTKEMTNTLIKVLNLSGELKKEITSLKKSKKNEKEENSKVFMIASLLYFYTFLVLKKCFTHNGHNIMNRITWTQKA